MSFKKAIRIINSNGVLLVFPILNKKEPNSLWNELYPRTKMKWEWTDDGDDRVAKLWHLMKELSDCKQVVYSKWYQGRATFFSRTLFVALLSVYLKKGLLEFSLNRTERLLFETLKDDSPLSSKNLKLLTELQGKLNEPLYNKSMKTLFFKFLIIAFGEVQDGAFPSLAVGATQNIYEDLWKEALEQDLSESEKCIDQFMPANSLFRKFFEKHSVMNLKNY